MSPIAVPMPANVALPQELERIYRAHAPLVYRTAWGVLGSREDAEDVVHTVFLRLLRRESPPDLQQNPKAYLYKAAVTASLDVLKAKRRRPVLVDADRLDIPSPDPRSSFDEELYERLYEAMARLNADAAAVLILRYMHYKSLADIGKELGLSRTAVGVRLFRSRARLRALLRVPPENSHG
jgi:RNA polymerase sigma-70 factor (ECF subfamily)